MSESSNQLKAVIDTAEEESAQIESDSQDEAHIPGTSSSSTSVKKKKKKKKSKVSKALGALAGRVNNDHIPDAAVREVLDKIRAEGGEAAEVATEETVRSALQELKIMDVVQGKAGLGGKNQKDLGEHKFWGTQPVPQPDEGAPLEDGYIEPSQPPEQVRQEPYPLPKDYEWCTVDITDDKQNQEVYNLLSLHYVEDDDASFRFQYSAEFLRWALKPPGYHPEWHVGVRVSATQKLVAFISGVPITLRVRGKTIPASEINYLCVHKKLRGKRLTPVLIREVTRQCHLKGVFQAIYTAGVIIPTPITVCRYYHRALNIPKLVDVHFTSVPRNMTQARMTRLHQVDTTPAVKGIREMESRDVIQVAELYTRYMARFDMWPVMTVDEVEHNFMSGRGEGDVGVVTPGRRQGQVTWAYVVEDPETKQITDFLSFYSLPSTIINSQKYGVLDAAYMYYYATNVAFEDGAEEDGRLRRRLLALFGDALIFANNAKFDVVNALTLMDHVDALQELKFGPGDGYLNYYLYNWRTAPLAGMEGADGKAPGKGVGVVML